MKYRTKGDTDGTVVSVLFDDGTYPMPLKTANKVLEIMDKQIATEDALTADIARLTAEIAAALKRAEAAEQQRDEILALMNDVY